MSPTSSLGTWAWILQASNSQENGPRMLKTADTDHMNNPILCVLLTAKDKK